MQEEPEEGRPLTVLSHIPRSQTFPGLKHVRSTNWNLRNVLVLEAGEFVVSHITLRWDVIRRMNGKWFYVAACSVDHGDRSLQDKKVEKVEE